MTTRTLPDGTPTPLTDDDRDRLAHDPIADLLPWLHERELNAYSVGMRAAFRELDRTADALTDDPRPTRPAEVGK